jgi:hypothetical protein
MNLSLTWHAYFVDQFDDKPSIYSAFLQYSKAIHRVSPHEKLAMAATSSFRCFAFVQPQGPDDMSATIQVCHHYSKLTDLAPLGWGMHTTYHVTLHGLGSTASAKLFPEGHPREHGYTFPKPNALLKLAATPDDLMALRDKPGEPPTTTFTNFVQLPPFLFDTLVKHPNCSPSDLFFIVRDAIDTQALVSSAGGRNKTLKTSLANDVIESAYYFLEFLWAASVHTDDLAITFIVPPPDSLPTKWATSQNQRLASNQAIPHQLDRNPAPASLPASVTGLDQATASLVLAASSLAASTDRLVDSRLTIAPPSASKSWSRQPEFVQRFVLRMMAQNEFDSPSAPTQNLTDFLALSNNTSAATQYLKNYLTSTMFCQDLRLDPFTVLCLTQLSPEYNLPDGPSRLSLFLVFDPATSLTYSTNEDIVDQATVDASGEHGMSYTEFKGKVNERKILHVPTSVNDLETTFRSMQCILIFMFGSCFAADQLATWTTHIAENRASYRHCSSQDKTFFAQQLTIVDYAIQAFFRNARQAIRPEFLAFDLLSFERQQQAIAVCNPMSAILHPRVQALFSKPPPLAHDSSKRNHGQMKKDDPTSDVGKMVKNPKPEPTFKLPHGKPYRDVFTAEIIRSGAPELNGTQICCRWQVLGRCYDKCPRSSTHVTLKDKPRENFSEFFTTVTSD